MEAAEAGPAAEPSGVLGLSASGLSAAQLAGESFVSAVEDAAVEDAGEQGAPLAPLPPAAAAAAEAGSPLRASPEVRRAWPCSEPARPVHLCMLGAVLAIYHAALRDGRRRSHTLSARLPARLQVSAGSEVAPPGSKPSASSKLRRMQQRSDQLRRLFGVPATEVRRLEPRRLHPLLRPLSIAAC